jgi:hypothetical protein
VWHPKGSVVALQQTTKALIKHHVHVIADMTASPIESGKSRKMAVPLNAE